MKKCIIIDDEQHARESLSKMIQRFYSNRMEVCGLAESVKEGVELIHIHNPDVVFLDVEMPVENGLQLFNHFKESNFHVIFTTAYQQYAISAIKYAALDYILKPINHIELGEAIAKLEKKDRINKNTGRHIESLLHNLNMGSEDFTKIMLPVHDGFELVRIRNIVYCKAEGNYSNLYTVADEVIIVSKPLKYLLDLLPDKLFYRPHKSYLINLNYIKSISRNNGGEIYLENGSLIPVAKSQFKSLLERMQGGEQEQ